MSFLLLILYLYANYICCFLCVYRHRHGHRHPLYTCSSNYDAPGKHYNSLLISLGYGVLPLPLYLFSGFRYFILFYFIPFLFIYYLLKKNDIFSHLFYNLLFYYYFFFLLLFTFLLFFFFLSFFFV